MKWQDLAVRFKDPILLASSSLIVISFIAMMWQESPQAATDQNFTADTVIPAGFVLVPIELQNAEAMSAIIGAFGVVDLFTAATSNGGAGGLRVGNKLRLLRAPKNPSQFAVLVPESEAVLLLSAAGPLVAVIQNPKQDSQGALAKPSVRPSRIQYYQGVKQ